MSDGEPRTGTDDRARLALVILWLLLGVVAVVRATPEVRYMVRAFGADGPNTVGEAGKVYFADRIRTGRGAFSSGDEAPYYPSVHGALLHASVGLAGRALNASPTDLYAVGRWASVSMTALAWVGLALLGLRLRLSWPVLGVGALLWIGTYPLVEHTVSYRPDNWVLMLSVLAAWILTARSERRWALPILVLLPPVAFHVKATGLLLVGAVGLVHLVRRQWRRAALVGAAQVALVGLSVLALDLGSGGEYVRGLSGAVKVPWSAGFLPLPHLLGLGDPLIPLFALGPLPVAILVARGNVPEGSHDALSVLGCFWAVTLVGYGLATMRAGSSAYYLLEPASYGLLLLLCGVQLLIASRRLERFRWRGPLAVLVIATLASVSPIESAGRPHGVDISLGRTELVGAFREALAARVNAQDGVCYSDDPGLNVLLDRPAVIYPLLQLQMMETGRLAPETLFGPVERHDHRCVIFSGIDWRYRGRSVVPMSFRTLVAREYPWVEAVGPYRIHYREQSTLPVL